MRRQEIILFGYASDVCDAHLVLANYDREFETVLHMSMDPVQRIKGYRAL